jgi:hypothetical protein
MYCLRIVLKQRLYKNILLFIFISTIYIIIFSIYLCFFFLLRLRFDSLIRIIDYFGLSLPSTHYSVLASVYCIAFVVPQRADETELGFVAAQPREYN